MEPLERGRTGAEQLAFMSGMLNGAAQFRLAHPELEHRWIDVAYADLTGNPMSVVREIHRRLEWPLERPTVEEMEAWLSAQEERRRRETRHSYSLEEYELAPADVSRAFEPYLDFATSRGLLQGEAPAR